jgi:hypothetical protein
LGLAGAAWAYDAEGDQLLFAVVVELVGAVEAALVDQPIGQPHAVFLVMFRG